jgi:hypothetical protein
MRKRHTQSEQLVHVMQQFLASGSECIKARYPIVIQIEGHDAVYVTDRGDLPVAPDKLQGLLAQARPPRKSPSRGTNPPPQDGDEHPVHLCQGQSDATEQPAGEASHVGPAPFTDHTDNIAPTVGSAEHPAERPVGETSHMGPARYAATADRRETSTDDASRAPSNGQPHVA